MLMVRVPPEPPGAGREAPPEEKISWATREDPPVADDDDPTEKAPSL
jgi:hypothetical protein